MKTINTKTADCYYFPAFNKSLFQVKEGVSVLNALEEACLMTGNIRFMLDNYSDKEGAANSGSYLLNFVEGLIESVHSALLEAGYQEEEVQP